MNDNMKKTRQLLLEQQWALIHTIQWLDMKNFSNTPLREQVDKILNHSKDLEEQSRKELDEAENYKS